MATDRFNRQFILLDFEDLGNPEYMAFVRSPEFSTYLIMRRYVWRSDKPHPFGLDEYYAQGHLACSLSREKVAEALGGVSARQVTRDINALLSRGVIRSISTGRGNIYILGKWGRDPEENVYYEYFLVDKLHTRVDENVQAEWTSDEEASLSGQKRPVRVDKSVQADSPLLSTNNRESKSNREGNIDFSKGRSPEKPSVSIPEKDVVPSEPDPDNEDVLESAELEILVETCSREFNDREHLESNLTRTFNLWARTKLDADEMLLAARRARDVTKERISLSAIRDHSKRMPYFFSVLEGILGLRDSAGPQRTGPG